MIVDIVACIDDCQYSARKFLPCTGQFSIALWLRVVVWTQPRFEKVASVALPVGKGALDRGEQLNLRRRAVE